MKKALLISLLLLIALAALPAAAETEDFTFEGPMARLTLDTASYQTILTPLNLEAHKDWLSANGIDPEQTKIRFEDDGILLEAYDTANARTLVVTALADVNARELFDVNTLEETERKQYRQSHSNGTFYGIQGIQYASAQWRNYGANLGRFLKLKYARTVGGQVVCRGYQRRTIRNGYTITFDMQVTGRGLKDSDEKALDRALGGFTFLEILSSPVGACKLILTDEPDSEVTTEKITIAGRSEDSAAITATLISLTDNKTSTFSATANSKGKFSLDITFPQQGTYSITLMATTTDSRTAQRTMTVMYQRDYIPINLKTVIPSVINADSLTVSGTTVAGVTVQISVSGPVSLQKSKTGKSFSFTVSTREEGTYQILLTATRKDMSPRLLSFTTVRTLTDAEKLARIQKNAVSVKYSVLKRSLSKYAGKVLTLSGYVIEARKTGEEYVVQLAVNRSGNDYRDFVYIICKTDPSLAVYDHVRMYGTLSENPYVEVVEGSGSHEYPRFELLLFETLN